MEIDAKTGENVYKLNVKGQNDRKMEINMTAKSTLGDLLQCIDDQTKDKEGWTHYKVGNTRVILNGSSIANALITDKYESTVTLDTITGLTDGSVLTLAKGQPNRNRSRAGNVDSPAFSNFAQFKTLVRNVKACNRHAQQDLEPITRRTYEPEDLESLPAQPSKSGVFTPQFVSSNPHCWAKFTSWDRYSASVSKISKLKHGIIFFYTGWPLK